jgi:hypothetical protein
VVDGEYRYVRSPRPGDGYKEELFDLSADVDQLEDVHAERAEVAERMSALADSYLEGKPPWGEEAPSLEMDEMQLQQLRALGYAVP